MGASPGVADGRVFVVSFEGQIRAFDALDGQLLWQKALGAACESSPQVVDGRLLFAASDGRVRALDPATGKALWMTDVGAKVTMAVTGVDGSRDRRRLQRQRARARPADRSPALADARRGPAVRRHLAQDGRLFVASSTDKNLTALLQSNGHELWQQDLHDFAFSGPGGRAANVVVAGSYDGHLRAFDTTDGSLLWDVAWAADLRSRRRSCAASSGPRASPAAPTRSPSRAASALQRFGHGRYGGTRAMRARCS